MGLLSSLVTASWLRSTAAVGFLALPGSIDNDVFRQLEEILPTPNTTRTASGAPGSRYWQQQADYDIDVELDDEKQRIIGSETITYTNNSPDTLRYLWLQLDANIYAPDSDAKLTRSAPDFDRISYRALKNMVANEDFDGSTQIRKVRSGRKDLDYTIVKTMMRIDLPKPLAPGKKIKFSIDWDYDINDSRTTRGRTGYEYFEEDDNYIYEIAQWFPRMAPYDDVNGWQNKQFLGSGEFALEFGDYEVSITAPEDHVVTATGELKNARKVLSDEQRKRLKEAKKAKKPVFIVTPEEAEEAEKTKAKGKKTWVFKADNVRDFAFASSRKFIWDAQGHNVGDNEVMAMSVYPKEGEPLWSRYSTHSIIHTLNVYSRYTFEYPYPVAISVNGPVGGMEYPMICFNGPRPEEDGTYSPRTKYGLISVIIHEVGHNYFPMIINSDERQWTWMDEGLNTFLQYLSEQEWEDKYPSRRGEPRNIVEYMQSEDQVPIMTNSESLLQFGNNAYGKPATALNILRETIMGRELFDFAFKEYARRWKFKRPMPADFFRTMEDASGVDLDWFWRGWFYSTDHVDLAIKDLKLFTVNTGNPTIEKAWQRTQRDTEPESLSKKRNAKLPKRVDEYESLKDFYNSYDPLDVTPQDKRQYERMLEELEEDEKALLKSKKRFYVIDIDNVGGLVMPVIYDVEYTDGSHEEFRIPAEIWRQNAKNTSKLIVTDKEIQSITLDPHLETADTDLSNNYFPPKPVESRFQLFKWGRGRGGGWGRGPNPMQEARDAESGDEAGKGRGKGKGKGGKRGKAGKGKPGNGKPGDSKPSGDQKAPAKKEDKAQKPAESSKAPAKGDSK